MIRNSQKYFPDVGVYSYLFNQTTPGAPAYQGGELISHLISWESTDEVVYHGSDVPYLFGATYAGGNYTAADVNVTNIMANYWYVSSIHT